MSRAQRAKARETITPRAEGEERGTGDRFLIVVEGEQTERRYFEDLCGKLHFSPAKVIVEHPDSDPLNMVEEAIRLRNAEEKREQVREIAAYDQAWVVCDRETKYHHRKGRLQEACVLALQSHIHMAVSIPTFEYWLLLHHAFSRSALADCAAAEKALSELQTNAGREAYSKTTYPLAFYVEKEALNQACNHADRIRADHEKSDTMLKARYWARDYIICPSGANAPDGNPCTDVDELVRQLNLAANPDFRRIGHHQCRHPEPFTRR